VHNAWLVVREYLATGDARPRASLKLFSSRWLSSPNGRDYEQKASRLDFEGYHRFGNARICVAVIDMRQPLSIRLRADADCHLAISGEPVDLIFTLRPENEEKQWVIDGVEIH
jgi:hypothetical protein